MRRTALVGPLIALLLIAAGAHAAEEKQPQPQYTVKTIEGYSVHVADDLLAEHKELADEALRLLESHLYKVGRVVPERALAELRKVRIWLHYKGKGGCAAYHPSRKWLEGHGWNPEMARSVDLGNAKSFIRSSGHQPFLLLHELAHAYHHQVLGYGNNGNKGRAYAITNPKEYFAETSEAFFGTNDVFPFVRAELREHDPEMFKLLKKLWAGKLLKKLWESPPEKAKVKRHGAHRQERQERQARQDHGESATSTGVHSDVPMICRRSWRSWRSWR
ncbi:MAG: hypothetical protein ACYSU0_23005 [Planctomycetota bacterium]